MAIALRYYWVAAKGYRLRPWASPYLRWRLETFFGGDMHSLGPLQFFRLIWGERARFMSFLAWTEERRQFQRQGGFNLPPEPVYNADSVSKSTGS